MFAPNDIANKKFDKTMGFGYKAEPVEEYLEELANYVAQLLEEKKDLEKKMEVLADKLEEYRQDEESMRNALLGAQKLGDGVIRESKTKAEIILRDATNQAEKMVEGARMQIEQEQLGLAKMQREVGAFKNRLLALYRQHLELINALPEDENAKRREAAPPPVEPQPEPAKAPQGESPAPGEETPGEEGTRPRREFFKIDMENPEEGTPEGETEPPARKGESRFSASEMKFGEGFELSREETVPGRKRR